ncbi:F-box associated domain containing protein [Tanacetum coccineum]
MTTTIEESRPPSFPLEIIHEILLKATVKSLLQCKSVCKDWACDMGIPISDDDLKDWPLDMVDLYYDRWKKRSAQFLSPKQNAARKAYKAERKKIVDLEWERRRAEVDLFLVSKEVMTDNIRDVWSDDMMDEEQESVHNYCWCWNSSYISSGFTTVGALVYGAHRLLECNKVYIIDKGLRVLWTDKWFQVMVNMTTYLMFSICKYAS